MEDVFRITGDVVQIGLKITPGASKNGFIGIRDKRLCVRIAAPPQDNKANACLQGFLAKSLGCAKKDVALVKGERSKLKIVEVPVGCAEKLRKIISAFSS